MAYFLLREGRDEYKAAGVDPSRRYYFYKNMPVKVDNEEDADKFRNEPSVFFEVDKFGNKVFESVEENFGTIQPVNEYFFGTHVTRASKLEGSNETPIHEEIGYKSYRFWDAKVNWRHIETNTKGVYDWSRLDEMVEKVLAADMEILYCMGSPPNWATGGTAYTDGGPSSSDKTGRLNGYPPSNLQDWADFINALIRRYHGKIKYYEVWNEPNLSPYFVGTVSDMINLTKVAYETIKAFDPEIQVVSASPTIGFGGVDYLDSYMAGAKDYVDIVGVHLYPSPGESQPEMTMALAKAYKAVMAKYGIAHKPLWNTESTWHSFRYKGVVYTTNENANLDFMPDDIATSYMFRYLICHWAAGVDRTFFYGTDTFWSSLRLIERNNKQLVVAGGYAYQRAKSWLVGAKLNKFYRNSNGTYAVSLSYRDKRKAMIFWATDDSKLVLKIPTTMGINKIISADGTEISNPRGDDSITLTMMPVMLIFNRSTFVDLPDPSELVDTAKGTELVYNHNFSIPSLGAPTSMPVGWSQAGSPINVSAYAGSDAPPGSNPITVTNLSGQYGVFRQNLPRGMKRGRTYRISITYKLPVSNSPYEWNLKLESGTGTVLSSAYSGGNKLSQSTDWRTSTVEFLYPFSDRDTPPNMRVALVNDYAGPSWNPIHVASISIQDMTQTPDETHYPFPIRYSSVIPSTGSYAFNDIVLYTDANIIGTQGTFGLICNSSGTFGTLTAVTGSLPNNSFTLTINTADALKVGDKILLDSTDVFTIDRKVNSTTYETQERSIKSYTNVLVTYRPPTFMPLSMPSKIISGTITANQFGINDAAGTNRQLVYNTNGVARWILRAGTAAETGSNFGTDFELSARDDDGNLLFYPILIRRRDGKLTFKDTEINGFLGSKVNTGAWNGTGNTNVPTASDYKYFGSWPNKLVNSSGELGVEGWTLVSGTFSAATNSQNYGGGRFFNHTGAFEIYQDVPIYKDGSTYVFTMDSHLNSVDAASVDLSYRIQIMDAAKTITSTPIDWTVVPNSSQSVVKTFVCDITNLTGWCRVSIKSSNSYSKFFRNIGIWTGVPMMPNNHLVESIAWLNSNKTKAGYGNAILPQTVGASPYAYQNTASYPVEVYIGGGTLTNVEFTRDNVTFFTLGTSTNRTVLLSPGDRVKVTYTAAPTMHIIPR